MFCHYAVGYLKKKKISHLPFVRRWSAMIDDYFLSADACRFLDPSNRDQRQSSRSEILFYNNEMLATRHLLLLEIMAN